jgi:predicted alpha/beta-hydrolase family hydrolase
MNRWTIRAGADETVAVWDPAATAHTRAVFVCAHGAGGHMDDKALRAARDAFREIGVGVVRFNFFYRARGSGRPDPMPKLLDCFNAVIARVREELSPQVMIVGGRSMGGRAASMLVAADAEVPAAAPPTADGLLLLAYPLHPPGHPEKQRTAHLPAIRVPVLCFNGTRDPFCDPPLMNAVVATLSDNWQMHWLADADHSFHVLKRSGRTDADVLTEVAQTTNAWFDRYWRSL